MKNLLQKLSFSALLLASLHAFSQVPKLNSFPSVQPTIFLDFDGQTVQTAAWQNGNAFVCAPSTFTNAQITEVFNRVSEDYRPFAINVTTDSAKFLAAPVAKRIRMIVTTTSAWYPNVGGISYISSFTWGDDTPGFIFENMLAYGTKYIAECCTHESGHALGLSHQAKYDLSCNLVESYNSGIGIGETGWAPVMGNSYNKNMTGWNDGPTPYDCSLLQDNLTIITSQNGFSYRGDDFGETMNNTTALLNPVSFGVPGIISTPTDKDAFKIVLSTAGNLHLEAIPYNLGTGNDGANLDVMLLLYNNAGALIRTYNPLGAMSVTADTSLNAGTYYITVAGAGNNNTSNYGSLGSYNLTGFKGALPIHSVTLQGRTLKNIHELSWNVIADEAIASQVLEASDNGLDFHTIMAGNGSVSKYSYTPEKNGTVYYRLRVTSVIDQKMSSGVVALKGTTDKAFSVSTLVQQTISVNASDHFTFSLFDINGRGLKSGKLNAGNNLIDVRGMPKGIYVLQMKSDTYKQTERIIKQ